MPKVICKETCTVPVRGYIGEGEPYVVDKIDIKKYPFLKHFTDENGKDIEAEEPDDSAAQVAFPKHIGGANWELSNGDKFQGKKGAAQAAEQALSASA